MKDRSIPSLGTTPWPRSGGDRRNSGYFPCEGPDCGDVIWDVSLPDPPADRGYLASGAIVAADGCLRVVHQAILRIVSLNGRVLWRHSLRRRGPRGTAYSLPLALDDGSVWLTSNGRLLCERDGQVEVVARGELGDDSTVSLNVGYDGSIYCGGSTAASRWWQGEIHHLDAAGYDLLSPAVYPDGSVGLASYYGNGLCRRHTDGRLMFQAKTKSREQDGLVTINDRNEAACHALNDWNTVVVDSRGSVLWTFDRPATFSCIPGADSGWLALSSRDLTSLSPSGEVLWTREVQAGLGQRPRQALIDSRGFIYAPSDRGLEVFDQQGSAVYHTDWPSGETSALCPVAPGQMALIHENRLCLVGKAR